MDMAPLRLALACGLCLSLPPHVVVAAGWSSSSTFPPSPVCTGSRVAAPPPLVLAQPLSFCGLVGVSCCDAAADDALRERFLSFNLTDIACAATTKGFLCAGCLPSPPTADPTTAAQQPIPPPCASALSPHSVSSRRSSTQQGRSSTHLGLKQVLQVAAEAVASFAVFCCFCCFCYYYVYRTCKNRSADGGRQQPANCNSWFNCFNSGSGAATNTNTITATNGPDASHQGPADSNV